ncbi:hypothetical protein SAMN05880557_101309 [Pseudacidovorax sp. RU35E]|nr:hypothetical protein SAMN05880557_101309 [Pseudacidovorax sp. RU35E]
MFYMRVFVKMIDPLCIELGRTPLDAMNFVAFFKEKLCKIRTVLTCNTGY